MTVVEMRRAFYRGSYKIFYWIFPGDYQIRQIYCENRRLKQPKKKTKNEEISQNEINV